VGGRVHGDRADDQAADPAQAPIAEHQQRGPVGFVEQHGRRGTVDQRGADRNVRRRLLRLRRRLPEQVLGMVAQPGLG
jgi:hypothetical protein